MADPINVVIDRIPLLDYVYNMQALGDALYCSLGPIQRVDLPTKTVRVIAPGEDTGVMAIIDFHQPIQVPPDVVGGGEPDRRIYFLLSDNRIGEVVPAFFDQFRPIEVLPPSPPVPEIFAYAMTGTNSARCLYLYDLSRNAVDVIDMNINRMVGSIQLHAFAQDIILSPDDRFVYTAHPYNDAVSVIDTATWPPTVTEVPVDSGPTGLAMSADGRRLFVAQSGESFVGGTDLGTGALSVFDTSTMQGLWVYTGKRSNSVVVNAAGTRAYVANNGEDTVSVVDVSGTPNVIDTITGIQHPYAMTLSPDEKYLYATDSGASPAIAVVAI